MSLLIGRLHITKMSLLFNKDNDFLSNLLQKTNHIVFLGAGEKSKRIKINLLVVLCQEFVSLKVELY